MMQTQPEPVVDAEIIQTPATDTPATNGAEILMNLESMIKTHITNIDRYKTELKKRKEMLNDTFLNDPTYQEHDKDVKDAAKIRNATKSQLMKQPAAADLSAKVKEMSAELKETQDALSDYLREYMRMSGANEIEGEDGDIRDIVYIAKLVKRSSKNRR